MAQTLQIARLFRATLRTCHHRTIVWGQPYQFKCFSANVIARSSNSSDSSSKVSQGYSEIRFKPLGTQFSENHEKTKADKDVFISDPEGDVSGMLRVLTVGIFLVVLIYFEAARADSAADSYEELKFFPTVKKDPEKMKDYPLALHFKPRYVPDNLQPLVEEGMKKAGYDRRDMLLVRPFMAQSFVPLYFCYPSTFAGATMGLPTYLAWDSTEDVDLSKIRHKSAQEYFFGNPWTPKLKEDAQEKDVEALKETFVLSDQAKKFIVAFTATGPMGPIKVLRVSMSTIVFLLTALTMHRVNRTFGLLKPNRGPLRMIGYTFVSSLMTLLFISGLIDIDNFKQAQQFAKIAELGEEYLEGGLEYFEKAEQRGKLLWKLVEGGDNYFEANGCLKTFFFQRDPEPFEELREKLKEAFKKHDEEEKQSNITQKK